MLDFIGQRKMRITQGFKNRRRIPSTKDGEIYDRGKEGFEAYARGMENSAVEKVKILPFVKEGNILETGCGCGTVLELLSRSKPKSRIYGTDISNTMLKKSKKRKYSSDNVSVIKADAKEQLFKEKSLDTIIFCSVLHEVYSYSGYSLESVEAAIENAYRMLKPNGRLVIRDGIKPEESSVYMRFKKESVEKKFYRFAEEFGPYKVKYEKEKNFIKLKKHDAMEFLSKYIYDENWDIEVKEKFGFLTKAEYHNLLEKKGFKIIDSSSYLIDFLRMTYYEKDVELFEKNKNKFVKSEYPDSTLILIAEKVGGKNGKNY